MKPEQDKIYYLVADNYATAKSSPHLEVYRKKGVEVLLLSDRIDEWAMGYLTEFDGKEITSSNSRWTWLRWIGKWRR